MSRIVVSPPEKLAANTAFDGGPKDATESVPVPVAIDDEIACPFSADKSAPAITMESSRLNATIVSFANSAPVPVKTSAPASPASRSAPAPPLRVSFPEPPVSVSLPPPPMRLLDWPLPVIRLSRPLPVPLNAPTPVRNSCSILAPRVKDPVTRATSMPEAALSVMVSPAPAT